MALCKCKCHYHNIQCSNSIHISKVCSITISKKSTSYSVKTVLAFAPWLSWNNQCIAMLPKEPRQVQNMAWDFHCRWHFHDNTLQLKITNVDPINRRTPSSSTSGSRTAARRAFRPTRWPEWRYTSSTRTTRRRSSTKRSISSSCCCPPSRTFWCQSHKLFSSSSLALRQNKLERLSVPCHFIDLPFCRLTKDS